MINLYYKTVSFGMIIHSTDDIFPVNNRILVFWVHPLEKFSLTKAFALEKPSLIKAFALTIGSTMVW